MGVVTVVGVVSVVVIVGVVAVLWCRLRYFGVVGVVRYSLV